MYVAGQSLGVGTGLDYATVAYDAATGTQLWVARYDGPASGRDSVWDLDVSPDGTRVYVTGSSVGAGGVTEFATVAYEAATGAMLWSARYKGPSSTSNDGRAVVVSPDGRRVFVTGWSAPGGAAVAYDAATGAQLWVTRGAINAPRPRAIAISPDGSRVYATGANGFGDSADYATVAYSANDGSQIWLRPYNGPGATSDSATALDLSPDGTRLYVAGQSVGVGTGLDYATVAYEAATGTQLWVARYDGPASGGDEAAALVVSPDGSRVYVAGNSPGLGTSADYATVAYDAVTGGRAWVARWDGPTSFGDFARSLDVTPDGSRVYVTGLTQRERAVSTQDTVTISYSSDTGQENAVIRFDGGGFYDQATTLRVDPDGTHVYVAGTDQGFGNSAEFVTLMYDVAESTIPAPVIPEIPFGPLLPLAAVVLMGTAYQVTRKRGAVT